MRRDSADDGRVANLAPRGCSLEGCVVQSSECPHHFLMTLMQQRNITLLGRVREFQRPSEPVTSLKRKRPFFFTQGSSPHNILPICTMNHDLPDVMATTRRPSRGLAGGNAPNRPSKVWTMPSLLRVGFPKKIQQQVEFGSGGIHGLSRKHIVAATGK